MIFVTVGTHEQQFNRLIQCVDDLKKEEKIKDEVIIQTGFSTYEPKYCKWNKLFGYSEMNQLVKSARIIITHGGPASFIAPLQINKIPIVVPRRYEFGEHVNNHQLDFSKAVEKRNHNIIVVEEIDDLEDIIQNYDKLIQDMSKEITSNNVIFNKKLETLIDNLFK